MSPPSGYQGVIQPKGFPALPDGWVSEWETFPSADGTLQLFAVTHHSADWSGPRALVVLHGLGEHGGRYLHFPHYLKDVVDCVYCLDHRGHGRSEGLRGHVTSFDCYADDVVSAISRLDANLRKRFGKSEIHLFGHSMGGLIALLAQLKVASLPIRSASVSAPLLGIRVPVPMAKKAAAHALSRIWGSLHMTSEVNPDHLSHDKEVALAYVADRLVHRKVTPKFFIGLQSAMSAVVSRDSGFDYPLQVLVPLQDMIVDPEVSLAFFRDFKLRDKQLKTYPGFYHEPFNEVGRDAPFADLRAWIAGH